MQTSKKPWESKTLWFNLVALIGVVLVQVQAIPTIPQAWVPWLTAAVPVVNIALRMITAQPLGVTSAPPTPVSLTSVTPSPYMGVPSQSKEGVVFDTGPAAPPADLPTLPGKEGPHDGA